MNKEICHITYNLIKNHVLGIKIKCRLGYHFNEIAVMKKMKPLKNAPIDKKMKLLLVGYTSRNILLTLLNLLEVLK